MDGIGMDTANIHVCVDGRYATNHYPGIGRVTSMLCQAWAEHPRVRRLDIIRNSRTPHELFRLPEPQAHVHIHDIDAPPFGITEWWQLRQLMHILMPDWIYAPYLIMPPRHASIKRMLTIHDAIPLELNSMSLPRQLVLRQLVRFSMARADKITTVSPYAAQQIRRYYSAGRHIEVIPNGVADMFFVAPPSHHLATYGITQPFGLCVSSNQPHKNLDGLLKAWAHAYRSGKIPSDSLLVVAGHVDTRRDIPWHNPVYADIPLIHMPNPDDTLLNQLYHAAHLFVLSSLAEGFGLPILEALAAGRAVLCHDYPTLRELHGDCVLYSNMRHPQQVADSLHRLWHDAALRHQLRQRAQAHAQTFRWDTVADRYIAYMQRH